MWSLAGCDAITRFCVSVETDFSRSQAKTGAAATASSAAAANRRVIYYLLWKVGIPAPESIAPHETKRKHRSGAQHAVTVFIGQGRRLQ